MGRHRIESGHPVIERVPRRLFLLAPLLLAGAGAAAADSLEVAAAWDGWTRPGRPVEARLHVQSDATGKVAVALVAGNQEIAASLDAVALEPVRLGIPVAGTAGDPTIRATFPDDTAIDRVLHLRRAEQPLVVWATSSGPDDSVIADLADGFKLVTATPNALPTRTVAYSSIDSVVLDTNTVLSLDDEQLTAFLDHLGDCGRVVLIGASQDLLAAAQNASGCASGALSRASDAREAAAQIRAHFAVTGPSAIPIPQIAALRGAGGHWQWVAGILGACLLATCITIVGAGKTWHVAACALAGTVLVPLLIRLTTPHPDIVVWAESSPGAHQANYTALELVYSARPGTLLRHVPPLLAQPGDCSQGKVARWVWDPDETRFKAAEVRTALFGPAPLCFRGSFPIAQAARLERHRDGSIAISNLGAVSWPAAWLILGQGAQQLPEITAGASAVVTPNLRAAGNAGTRMAATRIAPGEGAVLLPLDLGALGIDAMRQQGWLMLHVPIPDIGAGGP
jgi:hypothetical protein